MDAAYERFASQPEAVLKRAGGVEDAFDAAVSALVMAEHQDQITGLPATIAPDFVIEGTVWRLR